MTSRRGRRGLAAGTGVIAGLLVMSSVAWACQGFRGRGLWEGNGVAGSSTDGTHGNLHYPPTTGATWDLQTDGVGSGAAAHHHCQATHQDELPGAGLDGEAGNPNWYGGGTAPVVRMKTGANDADIAVKVEPSTVCLDENNMTNKLPVLSGSNGYELHTASTEGPGKDGDTIASTINACHGSPKGSRIGSANAVKLDSSGYSVDGSGNPVAYEVLNFRAGGTVGIYRMICLWDASGETSDALAINVKTI